MRDSQTTGTCQTGHGFKELGGQDANNGRESLWLQMTAMSDGFLLLVAVTKFINMLTCEVKVDQLHPVRKEWQGTGRKDGAQEEPGGMCLAQEVCWGERGHDSLQRVNEGKRAWTWPDGTGIQATSCLLAYLPPLPVSLCTYKHPSPLLPLRTHVSILLTLHHLNQEERRESCFLP
jgi:hypothetical protein